MYSTMSTNLKKKTLPVVMINVDFVIMFGFILVFSIELICSKN